MHTYTRLELLNIPRDTDLSVRLRQHWNTYQKYPQSQLEHIPLSSELGEGLCLLQHSSRGIYIKFLLGWQLSSGFQ